MNAHRPPCIEWREKLALRHEDLSSAEQQALDAHIRTCEICASALADYHFFEARLDALPPPSIRPLPRLSPHFFEQTLLEESHSEPDVATSTYEPLARVEHPRASRAPGLRATIWRVLSIAAVLCLLVSAGALFQVITQSRQASHPSGATLLNLDQHRESIEAVGWSPDGQEVATASDDHTVKVWNAFTGNLVCTYTSDDVVYALAWSPDSKLLASGGIDNAVHIWNAADCSPNASYATHTSVGAITTLAWSPDGRYIASGGWGNNINNTAQVWDGITGRILFTIGGFTDVVSSIAWTRNGQKIAVGSWDGTMQIWDTHNRQELNSYSKPGRQPINAVAWSPDGHYLALGENDATVEVMDGTTVALVATYTQHTDAVNAVAWSPDGKYIASGSSDKTVRIWNPFSTSLPTAMVYSQHTDGITSLAWSPNGKEIISGSFDTTAKVWAVTV